MTAPRRERCSRCDRVCDVDARGRVLDHLRPDGLRWSNVGTREPSAIRYVDCEGSRKTSKESTSRREADRKLALHRRIADEKGDIMVMLDAFIEGSRVDPRIPEWRKLALFQYREKWGVNVAHPYRYETRVAPDNRRAETRGEVYCRFCGGCLFHQVKQPHELVAGSAEAQRHLTECALHALCGMRESVAPTFKALPFDELLNVQPKTNGPLFDGGDR